jgi:FMN reductase
MADMFVKTQSFSSRGTGHTIRPSKHKGIRAMPILLIAGTPSERSRSAALLDAVAQRLRGRGPAIDRLQIRDLSPQALLLGDATHRSVQAAIDVLTRATAVVIATPVYKAAYSGILKVFLDLLPQTAFKDKLVLPLATGGSPHHMLALDYALRPVLQSLSARHILPGVYATDSQVALLPQGGYQVNDDIGARLDEATLNLLHEHQRAASLSGHFEPVAFGDVRCSV